VAQVIIQNKTGQALDVVLVNDAGVPVTKKLPGRGKLGPLAGATVSKHTKALAARGVLKIRPA
jgi:hypothetical protein